VRWLCLTSRVQVVLTLRVIMINRLLRDDASKGRTGTKTHASIRDIWNTLKDPGECPSLHNNLHTHSSSRTNRFLVLRNDHLHPQIARVSIPRPQPPPTRFLAFRKQHPDHAIRLPPRHYRTHTHTKQWPFQRKSIPLHNPHVYRNPFVCDIFAVAFA
jgi:hypothetical protein